MDMKPNVPTLCAGASLIGVSRAEGCSAATEPFCGPSLIQKKQDEVGVVKNRAAHLQDAANACFLQRFARCGFLNSLVGLPPPLARGVGTEN